MADAQSTWMMVLALACAFGLAPGMADAQEQPAWRHGMASVGELKYPQGFAHFDYVNATAPKGGPLKLSAAGSFDTLNPVLAKGSAAAGLPMVFDTLMKPSMDEITAEYGLLAEAVSYPLDFSSVTFRLRPEARWADGEPVTPADVVFSFEKTKEHNVQLASYYSHVTGAEISGEREVTFRFNESNNRELPQIVGQLQIVPKHWWLAAGPDGKPRDIARTTQEPVMGSGPYKIAAVTPGASIRYELRPDYWGKDLNVNRGQDNFGTVSYTYYGDRDVEFEAFRSGAADFWQENQAGRWATGYDFPAVKDGRVKLEELPNPFRATGIMQALVPNMRRDKFKDERVRRGLNYVFDFEQMNKTVFFNQYVRLDSFFFGTELASKELPEGRELEILTDVKDKVPAEVFTAPYTNPVAGDPEKTRDNLRQAIALFKEAGWEIVPPPHGLPPVLVGAAAVLFAGAGALVFRRRRLIGFLGCAAVAAVGALVYYQFIVPESDPFGARMRNVATQEAMTFEMLLSSPSLERVAVPYAQQLRKIGIEARVRTVDSSQYINRTRSFDFDMTWIVWAESLNPGNEQAEYWGSAAAKQEGTKNYAGIADPGVDALIRKVIFATDRDDLVASVKALDRVLLAHNYVIPLYYKMKMPIAYWDRFERPAELPYYSIGFPEVWWSKTAGQ